MGFRARYNQMAISINDSTVIVLSLRYALKNLITHQVGVGRGVPLCVLRLNIVKFDHVDVCLPWSDVGRASSDSLRAGRAYNLRIVLR